MYNTIGGRTATGYGDATEGRMTHVDSELNRQYLSLSTLQENLAFLEQRLSRVLRDSMPTPAVESATKQTESMVPLAHGIAHNNARIQGINHQVQDIIDRLEI